MAPAAKGICDQFQFTTAEYDERPALTTLDPAATVSWGAYGERVREHAAALSAAGLKRGDTLALMLENRPEFHYLDMAAAHLGVATVSIYNTSSVEQIEYVVDDADCRVAIAQASLAPRLLEVRERGGAKLETVAVVDGEVEGARPWSEILAARDPGFDFEAAWRAVEPEDLLTLVYTSGTTGPPKGVQLTHGNLAFAIASMHARSEFPAGARLVSFLPMAHIAERVMTHYLAAAHGFSVTCCPRTDQLPGYMAEVRPQVFFSPPRLWEKFRAAALDLAGTDVPADAEPGSARPSFAAALTQLGLDELRVAIVGAAPCPEEVVRFWHAVGVPLREIYGMSETSGMIALSPADAPRVGWAGPPLDGIELRLDEQGEILVRSPGFLMDGYRKKPEATQEAIDADGWMHTGDIGEVGEGGYLRVIDRVKELIINAAGKNMSPANLEAEIKTSGPLISQACVVGDARPYNVALITADGLAVARHLEREGIPEDDRDAAREAVRAELETAIERSNAKFSRVEQIKRFLVLDGEWEPDGDELTPTMKLKRREIARKYAAEIDQLYS
jgi:long-chain acyl-CoA synthetase